MAAKVDHCSSLAIARGTAAPSVEMSDEARIETSTQKTTGNAARGPAAQYSRGGSATADAAPHVSRVVKGGKIPGLSFHGAHQDLQAKRLLADLNSYVEGTSPSPGYTPRLAGMKTRILALSTSAASPSADAHDVLEKAVAKAIETIRVTAALDPNRLEPVVAAAREVAAAGGLTLEPSVVAEACTPRWTPEIATRVEKWQVDATEAGAAGYLGTVLQRVEQLAKVAPTLQEHVQKPGALVRTVVDKMIAASPAQDLPALLRLPDPQRLRSCGLADLLKHWQDRVGALAPDWLSRGAIEPEVIAAWGLDPQAIKRPPPQPLAEVPDEFDPDNRDAARWLLADAPPDALPRLVALGISADQLSPEQQRWAINHLREPVDPYFSNRSAPSAGVGVAAIQKLLGNLRQGREPTADLAVQECLRTDLTAEGTQDEIRANLGKIGLDDLRLLEQLGGGVVKDEIAARLEAIAARLEATGRRDAAERLRAGGLAPGVSSCTVAAERSPVATHSAASASSDPEYYVARGRELISAQLRDALAALVEQPEKAAGARSFSDTGKEQRAYHLVAELVRELTDQSHLDADAARALAGAATTQVGCSIAQRARLIDSLAQIVRWSDGAVLDAVNEIEVDPLRRRAGYADFHNTDDHGRAGGYRKILLGSTERSTVLHEAGHAWEKARPELEATAHALRDSLAVSRDTASTNDLVVVWQFAFFCGGPDLQRKILEYAFSRRPAFPEALENGAAMKRCFAGLGLNEKIDAFARDRDFSGIRPYRSDEEAVPVIGQPYFGAVYDNGSTEIISLCCGALAYPTSMIALYKNNEKLFAFVLGLLRK